MGQITGRITMVSDLWVCQLCVFDFPGRFSASGLYHVSEGSEAGISGSDRDDAGSAYPA